MPVAKVKFPPPLSPATTILVLSILKDSLFSCNHSTPEIQSFSPAGNGATSLTEEGIVAFLKSTIATATF